LWYVNFNRHQTPVYHLLLYDPEVMIYEQKDNDKYRKGDMRSGSV